VLLLMLQPQFQQLQGRGSASGPDSFAEPLQQGRQAGIHPPAPGDHLSDHRAAEPTPFRRGMAGADGRVIELNR